MLEVTTVELTYRERLLLQTILTQEKEGLTAVNKAIFKNISQGEGDDIYRISVAQNERKIKEIEVLLKKLVRDDN